MKKSVFIACPSKSAPRWGFITSIFKAMNYAQQSGIYCNFLPLEGDPCVSSARQRLVGSFLDSVATNLLFVDDDMVVPVDAIVTLMSREKDIVGGVYRLKDASGTLCLCPEGEDGFATYKYYNHQISDNECFRVRYIGTGLLLIKRGVFEKMISDYPELDYRAACGLEIDAQTGLGKLTMKSTLHALFRPMTNPDGMGLIDDFSFCERARRSGFEIWCDGAVQPGHIGESTYSVRKRQF